MNYKINILLVFTLIFGCKENEPMVPEVNVLLEGKVKQIYSDAQINNLNVILSNDNFYQESQTNEEGDFSFLLESEGNYDISIQDTDYSFFDSTLFISKDTTVNILLFSRKQLNQSAYFPINVGNKWMYKTIHRIDSWDHETYMEIIDNDKNNYQLDQNMFCNWWRLEEDVEISKELEKGLIKLYGTCVILDFYLFANVGERIKTSDYSQVDIVSERDTVYYGTKTKIKKFDFEFEHDVKEISLVQNIGIVEFKHFDEFIDVAFLLEAWEIDGIAYGDTILLK